MAGTKNKSGGSRAGAGRPVRADGVGTVRVYIPADYDPQFMLDCTSALIDANVNRSTARTHDALNKILDNLFGV
jgi:hypothetical protein